MPERKTVKRRSNWYIYLISFVTTFIILFLVILALNDILFPESANGTSLSASGVTDYRPAASFNKNVLVMISDVKGGVPDYYLLLNYRPRDEIIVLVPLDRKLTANVRGTQGDFTNIYGKHGAAGIKTAVQGFLDIEIDNYIKFDKTSFIGFMDAVGTVTVNIPHELEKDGDVLFKAGSHRFGGKDVYNYVAYSGGDDGQIILSIIMSGFINENSRGKTAADLQNYAKKLINTTDTDYQFEDFTKNQQAYLYTTQYSYNPAENYVPLYSYDDDGNYSISVNSVAAIRDRFGVNG